MVHKHTGVCQRLWARLWALFTGEELRGRVRPPRAVSEEAARLVLASSQPSPSEARISVGYRPFPSHFHSCYPGWPPPPHTHRITAVSRDCLPTSAYNHPPTCI